MESEVPKTGPYVRIGQPNWVSIKLMHHETNLTSEEILSVWKRRRVVDS